MMTARLLAIVLVLFVALSHAAPTVDERLHVLEARVSALQKSGVEYQHVEMKKSICERQCVRAAGPRALTAHI